MFIRLSQFEEESEPGSVISEASVIVPMLFKTFFLPWVINVGVDLASVCSPISGLLLSGRLSCPTPAAWTAARQASLSFTISPSGLGFGECELH